MKKLALILTLCFFCFANFALAADNETEQTAKEPAAATVLFMAVSFLFQGNILQI